MATEKQISANRRNSQLSTGPCSEAGKSISRMNALKSGIHAQSHTIRGEDPEALARLAAEYSAEFQPVTPRQRDLVDTLVHNEWKIRRLRVLETAIWESELESKDELHAKFRDSHSVRKRKYLYYTAFDEIEGRLFNLQRRLHAYERSTQRALKQLHELRQSETESDLPRLSQPAADPSITSSREPSESESSAEIGFVPSNVPQASPAPDPQPPATASEGSAPRPISGHLLSRAIPVTDCTQTDFAVAAEVPEQPSR